MRKPLIITALILSQLFATAILNHTLAQETKPTWKVYFSPRGGATEAIVRELNNAKKTVLVQAYQIPSLPIANALIEARKRGVKVEIILDKKQSIQKRPSGTLLFKEGIPIRIDAQHASNHNKVMIIDSETVITGSFNFTPPAEENNAENLLVLHDKELAEIYTKNWKEHADHSKPYTPKN
jgi:phosphatidylserine/phosphatidylglycerophosphate/cardiolipin synthase-like enzyme